MKEKPMFTQLSPASLREILHEVKGVDGTCQLAATGVSMNPFLRDGDVVTVCPRSRVRPRTGDVIAFTHPDSGQLLLHRVISRRKGSYLTQGDNARQTDGLIDERHVIGTVTEVVRTAERVHFGLGPERLVIAVLLRIGWLSALLRILQWIKKTGKASRRVVFP
jgi:signal peptidase I